MIHRFVDLLSSGIVAYHREDTASSFQQIWKVSQSPGSDPTQVTSQTTTTDSDPDVSPDGSMIAFLRVVSGNFRLYVINSDGTGESEVEDAAFGSISAPMWHPDGTKILFHQGSGFVTIHPDGTNRVDVTPTGPTGDLFRPTWNRDGSMIAFQVSFPTSTVEELWVCDADGTNAAKIDNLTNTGLGGIGLSWAHNSDVIAYVRGNTDDNLYVINADGTGKTNITPGSITDVAMNKYAWAPDDSAIYVTRATTPWQVWKVPADGSGEVALSPTLATAQRVGEGIPLVFGDRVYVIRASTLDLVSVALDGSGLRVEDNINSTDADVFVELTGNGSEL